MGNCPWAHNEFLHVILQILRKVSNGFKNVLSWKTTLKKSLHLPFEGLWDDKAHKAQHAL